MTRKAKIQGSLCHYYRVSASLIDQTRKEKSIFPHIYLSITRLAHLANAKEPYLQIEIKENTSGQRIHERRDETQRNSSRRNRSRQHADIIYEALYQVLVLILRVT